MDWELMEERTDKGVLIGSMKPEYKYFFSVKAIFEGGSECKFSNIVKTE
jgi:hypothetical protein